MRINSNFESGRREQVRFAAGKDTPQPWVCSNCGHTNKATFVNCWTTGCRERRPS